jgi:DNA-binding HxlR family transcriptional regulator
MEEGTSISLGSLEGTEARLTLVETDATPVTHKGSGPLVEETEACELRDLLDRLSDKWSLLVLELLSERTWRFSELLRGIDDISQRMLTTTLRRLERDGLVRRTVHTVVPPQVDYDITDLGVTLLSAVQSLLTWSRANRTEQAAARDEFDGRD